MICMWDVWLCHCMFWVLLCSPMCGNPIGLWKLETSELPVGSLAQRSFLVCESTRFSPNIVEMSFFSSQNTFYSFVFPFMIPLSLLWSFTFLKVQINHSQLTIFDGYSEFLTRTVFFVLSFFCLNVLWLCVHSCMCASTHRHFCLKCRYVSQKSVICYLYKTRRLLF